MAVGDSDTIEYAEPDEPPPPPRQRRRPKKEVVCQCAIL